MREYLMPLFALGMVACGTQDYDARVREAKVQYLVNSRDYGCRLIVTERENGLDSEYFIIGDAEEPETLCESLERGDKVNIDNQGNEFFHNQFTGRIVPMLLVRDVSEVR